MPPEVRGPGWSCRCPRLGKGNIAGADPSQHFIGRERWRQIVERPRRKVSELVLELVRGPAGLVTTDLLNRAQLAKEDDAVALAVLRRRRLAADDEPEFATSTARARGCGCHPQAPQGGAIITALQEGHSRNFGASPRSRLCCAGVTARSSTASVHSTCSSGNPYRYTEIGRAHV